MLSNSKVFRITLLLLFIVGLGLVIKNKSTINYWSQKQIAYLLPKTWDQKTNEEINKLHPLMRIKALRMINKLDKKHGLKVRITSGFRSFAEQAELYAQGRTKPGRIVTKAKKGQSLHNYATAMDLVPVINGKATYDPPAGTWELMAKVGKEQGFVWGGDFRSITDKPHFQYSNNLHHSELLKRVRAGQLLSGGYVDLKAKP